MRNKYIGIAPQQMRAEIYDRIQDDKLTEKCPHLMANFKNLTYLELGEHTIPLSCEEISCTCELNSEPCVRPCYIYSEFINKKEE